MPEVDAVEYKGIVFRRYPESDNLADRRYYRPNSEHIKEGVEALHREVWEDHHGEIPDGHHIHHVDGDPTNNDIGNLECLSPEEHAEKHPDHAPSPDAIEEGTEAAKEWHRSEEGREWHRNHAKEQWEGAEPKTKECEQCGGEFEYYTQARFCSNACKAKWRRESGVDDVEATCGWCGETFTHNKHKDRQFCSRKCAARHRDRG